MCTKKLEFNILLITILTISHLAFADSDAEDTQLHTIHPVAVKYYFSPQTSGDWRDWHKETIDSFVQKSPCAETLTNSFHSTLESPENITKINKISQMGVEKFNFELFHAENSVDNVVCRGWDCQNKIDRILYEPTVVGIEVVFSRDLARRFIKRKIAWNKYKDSKLCIVFPKEVTNLLDQVIARKNKLDTQERRARIEAAADAKRARIRDAKMLSVFNDSLRTFGKFIRTFTGVLEDSRAYIVHGPVGKKAQEVSTEISKMLSQAHQKALRERKARSLRQDVTNETSVAF